MSNYLKAIAVMIGYIIGVGMFGLPFVVSRSGVLFFFLFFIVLSLTQYFIHLIYANVILESREYHILPGYAGLYLGANGKRIAFLAKITGDICALLAYTIVTGIFLNQLLSPYFGNHEFWYASLAFFIQALIVFSGIGMVARFELIMTALLLLTVFLIVVKGGSQLVWSNYKIADWHYAFLPYGALLFALDGNGVVPLVVKMLKRQKEKIRKVIRISTFLPALVIAVFTLTIAGVSGSLTTPDGLVGVSGILSPGLIIVALIFGVLAMTTSFLGVAESLKTTLIWDFKIKKNLAWAITILTPYLLYLFGLKDLIGIISFAGAVAGGLCAIILILIFSKLKKEKRKLALFRYRPNKLIIAFLISLFVFGIIYEIKNFVFGY